MSLLSRNSLSIVVGSQQIAVLHTRRTLTLRGQHFDVLGREVVSAGTEDGSGWHRTAIALESVLPRLAQPGVTATVILSNHFVNYALVPWRDNMSDADELAYARHCFKEQYDDASDAWDVRVSPGRAGMAALASAVDVTLLAELRGVLGKAGVRVQSIQPHLMVAFNNCHAGMEGRNAWFALLEPGNLCLCLLRNGQLTWMRKVRIGDPWQDEFSTILEREAYLAEAGLEADDVFLWAPQLEGKQSIARGRWNIMHLKPPLY